MQVLDESKLKSKTEKNGITTYTLQDEVYLGEVFDSLPHGIINKSETGMGATTLELNSHRNSIIVEPTKITASSKAYKHNALYVGSSTQFHPTDIQDKDIQEYISDTEKTNKKILVVADSLPRLMKVLGETAYNEYYLFLDEIDSFQMDSTFRDSMEVCLDYYKKFPVDKRLMVSATLMKFTDPELANESHTSFVYEHPTSRNITLVHVESGQTPQYFQSCVLEKVKERLEYSPNEKVMVAYNSVEGCSNLANSLMNQGIVTANEAGILCSVNNKKDLGDLYKELEEEKLPSRLTFATSAYFTGYDLKESYHLISVSGVQNRIHSLSEKKLKQIAGRCRSGLLSETIIYETRTVDETEVTFKMLVESAEKEILAVECIESNYSNDEILKRQLDNIRKLILERTNENGFRLARRSIDKKNVISYLNIDANLENQRVRRELYQDKTVLLEALVHEGHNVQFEEVQSKKPVYPTHGLQEARASNIRKYIQKLREIPPDLINPSLKTTDLTTREREVFDFYEEFLPFIDGNQLLDKIEEVAVQRDNRALKNLRSAAMVATLDRNHEYLKTVVQNLKVGNAYTSGELTKNWNRIFQSLTFSFTFSENEHNHAVHLTKLHFKVTKLTKPIRYKINGDNPKEFTIIQTRSRSRNFISEMFNYFEYYDKKHPKNHT